MLDERDQEQEALKVTRFSLFGNERRTRIILLVLAILNASMLALTAGYLFFNLSFDPYSPGRFLW